VPCNTSRFSQIIGNEKAKEILQKLLCQKTLPQVLLFHGPSGVGKGLFATEIATILVCSQTPSHPDIYTLYPDEKSDKYFVTTIRKMRQEAALSSFASQCKVFIIHDAEKMDGISSNTLLKTLEEPPKSTYFFLLSSRIDTLLPTIVSRCVKIPFFPLSEEVLADFIITKCHIIKEKKIAFLAQGSVARALKKISSKYTTLSLSPFFHSSSYDELRNHLDKLEEPSEENFHLDVQDLLEEMLYWIREHEPLKLEQAIPLIHQIEQGVKQHIKLKNSLEFFFIKFLHLNRLQYAKLV
jgi:DNA polymerase III subunit delta'